MAKVTPIKFVPKGECRLSYVHVFEPAPPMKPGDDPVRSVSLLFPKTDAAAITDLYAKLNQIIAETVKVGNITAAAVPLINNPLRDGDAEVAAKNRTKEYSGMVFMTAKSWRPIGVVNRQNNPIIDPDELYSGCWANVQIAFKYYNHAQGGKGIRVEVNLIQKTRDDDRFDGADNAADVFASLEPDTDSGNVDPAGLAMPSIPPLGAAAAPAIPAIPVVPEVLGANEATPAPIEEAKPAVAGGKITNPFAEFV